MQLTFLILVLCCYIPNSTPAPPPSQPDSTWRPSRYIIDNRRNTLFSKKLHQTSEDQTRELENLNPDSFSQKIYPIERYQKDLTAEASIPKFYRKYGENVLPRKIIKSLKINGGLGSEFRYNGVFEDQKNTTGILDTQNFLQNEGEVLNEVTSKTITTTEKVQSWVAKINNDVLTSVRSSTTEKNGQTEDSSRSNEGFDFVSPTTTSFPWELAKAKVEEENQIDNTNEKHVYETRIETVSYHQEVIFNPPNKQNWFRGELTQNARNYESPEVNYEKPEKNYETSEKNYQEPEKNYEKLEKNYEEPERNYEEPEKNYEEPKRNYEEPEKNYKEPERNYEEPERSYEEPERSYEEPERSYEEPEKRYEKHENNYELGDVMPMDGIQTSENEENQNKFGYVVEGTNYRKYRVEERTVDGFIVGEYGVVSHDDGSLRGVRYTADGNTNPQLIYETLIKFLSL